MSGEADNLFPDNHIGTIKPSRLRTVIKYLLAAFNRVHMDNDDQELEDVTALALDATQAEANARAETLRVAMLAHMDSVGSPTVNGDHLQPDPINRATLVAIPTLTDESDLTACIALVEGLNASLKAHETQPGVHFHDAVSTIGTPQFPLCHCSLIITADMDGMGGVTYSREVVNVSGGISVGDVDPDTFAPAVLAVPLTLPVEVASELRVTSLSLRLIPPFTGLSGDGIDPFLPVSIELGGSGDDATIGVLMNGKLSDTPLTVLCGLTYIMSIASTPSGPGMSISLPTTLGHVITDLNELLDSFIAHFEDA
jgi:hypothetical protein